MTDAVTVRRLCTLFVLLLPASLPAQEAPPDLTGRWQLNEKESEDARAKILWSEGPRQGDPRRPGRLPLPLPPGAASEGPQASIEGRVPPAFRGFLEPARTLTISGNASELSLDDGKDAPAKLPVDGKERKLDTRVRVAKWEGSILVVDSTDGGVRLITRYNLLPGTRKLEVYSRLSDRRHNAVTLRRVYDATEPKP